LGEEHPRVPFVVFEYKCLDPYSEVQLLFFLVAFTNDCFDTHDFGENFAVLGV
jgi:hypothetical protein